MKHLFTTTCCLLLASVSLAEVRLSKAFSSNMVLQRNKPIIIWGWADAKESVTVSFEKSTIKTKPDGKGQWRITLPAMKEGGPYLLTVRGKNTITFTNVMLGDVWLASGQSNMEWKLKQQVNNFLQEINNANYPNIRVLNVDNKTAFEPVDDFESSGWKVCEPTVAGDFSAVAYFFARHLWNKYQIPIGIIQSEWGGTPAEAWTSTSSLSTLPDFAESLKEIEKFRLNPELALQDSPEAKKRYGESLLKNDLGLQPEANNRWYQPGIDLAGWKKTPVPGFFDKEIYPGFDGLVWYQKTFMLPAAVESVENGTLSLGKIDDADTVWINGQKLWGTTGHTRFRSYSFGKGMLKAGENTIVVRVHDGGGEGGFYSPEADIYLNVGNNKISLSGDWLTKIGAEHRQLAPLPMPLMAQNRPTTLFNAMIHPILQLRFQGAIWYQGESNAGKAFQYRTLFPLMIRDWRKQFNQGDFPFLFVQLANYRQPDLEPTESDWAELREAQTMTLQLPNTGMATIIDIGEANDIHPKNKQDVGLRLALLAQKVAYGDTQVVAKGPTFKSATTQGQTMRLQFDNIGSGLMLKDKYGYVKGFAIAGEDGKFFYAKGELQGNEVVLSSPQVSNPKYVRYAWATNPDDVNLFNKEGLPATPFRTDHFKGITQP